MRVRILVLAAFVLAYAAIGGTRVVAAPACNEHCVKAARADAFVDSIGVNVHVGFCDWNDELLWTRHYRLLEESGIRHIRAGGPHWPCNAAGQIDQLYREAGIRNLAMLGPTTTPDEIAHMIVEMPHMELIEAANEYDLTQDDHAWWETLGNEQRRLATIVRSDTRFAGVKILCPSTAGYIGAEALYRHVGPLASFCDYGNAHAALDGYWPGTTGWGGPFTVEAAGVRCTGFYKTIAYATCYPRFVSGRRPVMVTESGYGPVVPDDWPGCGVRYDCKNWTSYSLSTKYLPRQFLAWFQNGNPRAYTYDWIDSGPAGGTDYATRFGGLLDGQARPKPDYYALKNLIATLRDPGPPFAVSPLSLALSGETANVRSQLFEKRDGTYYVLIWIETSGQDPNANPPRAIAVAPQRVALALGRPIRSASATTIETSGALSAPSTLRFENGQASLSITDAVTIVRLALR